MSTTLTPTSTQTAAPGITTDIQQRISMARMLCILCMIFVHVPDGQAGLSVYAFGLNGFDQFIEAFVVEGPGRTSAALLSVLAGYLATLTLQRAGSSVIALYRRRLVSIVVPMIIWASLTYFIYFLLSQIQTTFLGDATTLLDHINVILFLTEMPDGATMHLGFLRDLFVCILLLPIILPALERIPWVLLTVFFSLYFFEHDQSAIIILRPLVLLAFTLGAFMAVRNVRMDALDRYWLVFTALAVTSTLLIMRVKMGYAPQLVRAFAEQNMQFTEVVLYPLSRLTGSLAIWTTMPLLMGGKLQAWIEGYSPYLFVAYCSHFLSLTIVFFVFWQPLFGSRNAEIYILWFLCAPLLSMLMAVCIVKVALFTAPPVATILTGGRIKSEVLRA